VNFLFAFGLDGICRLYLSNAEARYGTVREWWARASAFDRRWLAGTILLIPLALTGFIVYASSRSQLEAYLQMVQMPDSMTHSIALFSIWQAAGGFVVLLTLSVVLLAFVLRGTFSGPRVRAGVILLGLLLLVDFVRADSPWVVYWNYEKKYASNDILEFLRGRPWENRVSRIPLSYQSVLQQAGAKVPENMARELAMLELYFNELYEIEWKQHHFQYYNIQSLDIIQDPRPTIDWQTYTGIMSQSPARWWELNNNRYLLGLTAWDGVLNNLLDPAEKRFHIKQRFDLAPKQGETNFDMQHLENLTVADDTNGPLALFEFTGALPRASLYSDWLVPTNDAAAMAALNHMTNAGQAAMVKRLGPEDFLTFKAMLSPDFNPHQLLIVDGALAPPKPADASRDPGTVAFESYAPKDVKLKADVKTPAVLLLADKYDPVWKVTVDGKPAEMLRCNYIMRGVRLEPGQHEVEFTFAQGMGYFYVSGLAIACALGIVGWLAVSPAPPEPEPAETPPARPREVEPAPDKPKSPASKRKLVQR
jgi:hypothetical protein